MSYSSLKQLNQLDLESNPAVLSDEEGYMLTERYVSYLYYHQEKFAFLRTQRDLEDIISDCYLHFLEKKLFKKYNSTITSKKYHVMLSCKRHMIDISRKLKPTISLETPVALDSASGEEITLQDVLPSKDDVEAEASYRVTRDKIMDILDKEKMNSKVTGRSPIRGPINFTLSEIAIHLEAGYSEDQIATMFTNPYNGNSISKSYIHQMILRMRDICKPYAEVL